ncbi:Amyloid protein-binding protein 2 [Papilio xuthus]|uniref:Amyloid protein-binding protein 2 n=1 Tax=Papilio xuthus TaxID=66420 RepID=A0A194QF02_PAPXU|nr:Amyloid protein-binding protein 2 [Papilio xuthus]
MMHLKAIAIKQELLGAEDYEVGLSVGHLASLYNYHMNMHCAAEKLYLRSIAISQYTYSITLSYFMYEQHTIRLSFVAAKDLNPTQSR